MEGRSFEVLWAKCSCMEENLLDQCGTYDAMCCQWAELRLMKQTWETME